MRWLICLTALALPLALGGCLEDIEDTRPDRRSPLPDGGQFDPGPRPQPGSGYGSGSGSGSGGSGSGGRTGQGSGALTAEDAGVDATPDGAPT